MNQLRSNICSVHNLPVFLPRHNHKLRSSFSLPPHHATVLPSCTGMTGSDWTVPGHMVQRKPRLPRGDARRCPAYGRCYAVCTKQTYT